MKKILITVSVLMIAISHRASAAEHWPTFTPSSAQIAVINERFDGKFGHFHDGSYVVYSTELYEPLGDYLGYSNKRFMDDGEIVISPSGLPKVAAEGIVYFNPVTLEHYALSEYGKFIKGNDGSRDNFIQAVEKLVQLEQPDGSFRYPIPFHIKTEVIRPGWVSAMAQGQVLSVYARAFHLTGDAKYIEAGERAFSFLTKPLSEGGLQTSLSDLDPSLSGYIFFPEYVFHPIDYTLNGYMFTLLGIYDWSKTKTSQQERAKQAFESGILTLEKILPYYNISGYSTYDLGHVVSGLPPFVEFAYENVHVYLLHALNSISPHYNMSYYEGRWAQKIDEMNSHLRFDAITVEPKMRANVGDSVRISVSASGGNDEPKLFQFAVKHKGIWTFDQPYSQKSTFDFTPTLCGHYDFGLYAKDKDSVSEFDSFRAVPFEVLADPPRSDCPPRL